MIAGAWARGQRLLLVLAALCLGVAGCGGAGAGTPAATPGQAALGTATVSASRAAAPSSNAPAGSSQAPSLAATQSQLPAPTQPATAMPPATATLQPSATTQPAMATQRPAATLPSPPATLAPPSPPSATPSAQATAGPGGPKEALIRQLAPLAQAEQADSGVPAAFSIALAASETGWGASPLMKTANNYLGLTCSPPSEGLPCARYGGALWNSYSSPLNAFLWHGRWLRAHSQFAAAFQHTGDVAAFTREIWRCYISCAASFPQSQYDGTMALIAQYNLEQYDAKP